MEDCQKVLQGIVDNIEKVIIGKRNSVELIVTAMACGGHVLIEDIPGVGKTSLVSALSRSVSCKFKRIQFTPDVLPSDVTGFSVYNQKTGEFDFHPGAVMSNFVLADEINRATPKTQSSLLEAMDENQVTVDGKTYQLDQPFMVLATENPIEYLGTYPLPEAQIDRFMVRVSIGYPGKAEEIEIISMDQKKKSTLAHVATAEDVIRVREIAATVHVDPLIKKYIVDLVSATRISQDISLGASPRGSISLYKMSQAYALYCGRDHVIPDDVKMLAPCVLSHRLFLSHEAKKSGKTATQIIENLIGYTRTPAMR